MSIRKALLLPADGSGAFSVWFWSFMADKPVKQTFWTFYYHNGPAPKFGKVEARDEAWAMKVATHWCRQRGFRPPASVQPDVLATEDILRTPLQTAEDPTVILDPVGATTAVNG